MPVDPKKPSIDKDGVPFYPAGAKAGDVYLDAKGNRRDPLGASAAQLAAWTKQD